MTHVRIMPLLAYSNEILKIACSASLFFMSCGLVRVERRWVFIRPVQ